MKAGKFLKVEDLQQEETFSCRSAYIDYLMTQLRVPLGRATLLTRLKRNMPLEEALTRPKQTKPHHSSKWLKFKLKGSC